MNKSYLQNWLSKCCFNTFTTLIKLLNDHKKNKLT